MKNTSLIGRLNNQKSQGGFTVSELMIATAVFSILLLLSLAGFLQIGQLFYKGTNITQTSDAANQVVKSLKNDIAFDPESSTITVASSPASPAKDAIPDRCYFSAGFNRYAFI